MNQHHAAHQKSTTGRVFPLWPLARGLSHAAPAMASRLAGRLFVTPPRPRPPERERAWADGAERTTVASPFGELAAWVWGGGPSTVVLVHGWAGRGLQLGAFARPLMARGFRVVAYDGPGHGASPGRSSSMPWLAAGAAAAARQFGPGVAIVAHSLGATAVMYAMAGGMLSCERMVSLGAPAELTAIGDRFAAATGFSASVVERMKALLEERYEFSWEAAEPLAAAARLGTPALVIHDRDDREIPVAEGRALAEAWPGAELLISEGLGHRRLLRDHVIVDRVVNFIAGSEGTHEGSIPC